MSAAGGGSGSQASAARAAQIPAPLAHRAVALLEDSIEKLSLLDTITPDVFQHRDELSGFIGDEISRAIQEQRHLEERYEELIAQRASLKGLANKSQYKETQAQIQDVSRALRESTKTLVRNLKENPNISGNLIKLQRDRAELADLLTHTIRELRDSGTFTRLIVKVDEDNQAHRRLNTLSKRVQQMRATVAQLEDELTEERRTYKEMVTEQRQSVTHLKSEVQKVRSSTTVDSQFQRRQSQAHMSTTRRLFKQDERKLEHRIKELQQRLAMENTVHNETVRFLDNKLDSLRQELDAWTLKYDDEHGALMATFERVESERNELLEKLTRLRKRKEDEEAEARAKREAEEREAELQRLAAEEDKRNNAAASTIQHAVSGYLTRKAEDEARRAAEKKNKGGKKKK